MRVLANGSSIMEFLPEELSAFMLENPLIQADIEERFSPDVVRGVAEGNADLGICRKPMAVGDLEFVPYRQTTWGQGMSSPSGAGSMLASRAGHCWVKSTNRPSAPTSATAFRATRSVVAIRR